MKRFIAFIAIMTVVASGLFADNAYIKTETDSFSGDDFVYFFVDDSDSGGLFIMKMNMTKTDLKFYVYEAYDIFGLEGEYVEAAYKFDDEDAVYTKFGLTDVDTAMIYQDNDWSNFNMGVMENDRLIVRIFKNRGNDYFDYVFDLDGLQEIFAELGIM